MENTYVSLLVVVILAVTCSQAFPTQPAQSDSNNGQREVTMEFGTPLTAYIVSPDGTVTTRTGLKGIIFKKVNKINIIPYSPYGLPFTMAGQNTAPQTLMTAERRQHVEERINHLENVCDNLYQQLFPLMKKKKTSSSVYPILQNVLYQEVQLADQKRILHQFNDAVTSYSPKIDSFDADLDVISKDIEELVQTSNPFLESVTTVSPVV